ncbi:hypothetical protein GCK32_002463 [Trichostrongylus colubriformis]|uniref:Uncharacterized protein n=1 Tax=Trichostrongylus colubriformis TaxID=6319 RepID=A0AAN8FKF6_TRICO
MRVKKPRVSAIKKCEIIDTEEVTRQKARLTKVNRSPKTRRSQMHHEGPLVAKETSGSQKARSSRGIVGSTEHDSGNASLLKGRQTRGRPPVAVSKNAVKKRRTSRLPEVPEKTTVTRKRGRPRQSRGQVKGTRTLRRRSRKMCGSANEREEKERVSFTILPRLLSVGESSEPNKIRKKNRALKKHEEIAGSENKRGRLLKRKSEPHDGGGKESSHSEASSARKRIIELVYEAGYTFRSIEMSHFHLDVRTRRLYLNNASEVVKSTELMDLQLKNGVLLHNYWRGSPEFAPLSWHEREEQSVVRVTDCAEALFYIILELMGLMTWRGLNKEEIKCHKLNFDKSVLPVPLIEYCGIVHRAQEMQISKVMFHDGYLLLNGRRGGATSSVLDFRKLFMKLLALYKIFGGVGDDDTPYDFDVVQDPIVRKEKQAQLVELFKAVHLMKEKVQILKADLYALAIRKEYAKRCAAQTRRERAAASARASAFTSELNITE